MSKELNEEWRSKVRGMFESATADTIFEMPETDDELAVDTEVPADLGMGGDDVTGIGGEEETITLTKDALKELILAAKSEEAEEVGDEVADDLEDAADEVEDVEDEVENVEEVAAPIPEVDDSFPGDEDSEDAEIADDLGDIDDDIAGDAVEDALEDEDEEVNAMVDKAFEIAAGGVLGAEQVAQVVGAMSDHHDDIGDPEGGELADVELDAADDVTDEIAEGDKKPDADGDGVPDWADKKHGEDDHAKDEDKE